MKHSYPALAGGQVFVVNVGTLTGLAPIQQLTLPGGRWKAIAIPAYWDLPAGGNSGPLHLALIQLGQPQSSTASPLPIPTVASVRALSGTMANSLEWERFSLERSSVVTVLASPLSAGGPAISTFVVIARSTDCDE